MRHHGLSKESACFFSFFFKRRFFSLFGPDINRLQSIPQEPLVISCLHFHSVGEVMSDFTFTQRLKKKLLISSWPCFNCCIKINWLLSILQEDLFPSKACRRLQDIMRVSKRPCLCLKNLQKCSVSPLKREAQRKWSCHIIAVDS